MNIMIDADACPVKEETYRVAGRYGLPVILVANTWMRIPNDPRIRLQVVAGGFDAADDWIVENLAPHDIVVTADILLAGRCIEKDAHAISPTGKTFTGDNIGASIATRNLMADLRDSGQITGGPPPIRKQDRSRFLQNLDTLIQSIRRKHPST